MLRSALALCTCKWLAERSSINRENDDAGIKRVKEKKIPK
jgi:hypothetical protein